MGIEGEMKALATYRENALKFERMAEEESDSLLKTSFEKQAVTCRQLAAERAKKLGVPRPPVPYRFSLRGH
jgi:hypothetical protein